MILARVKQNKRITAEDHFQDTRHIVLELPEESGVIYEPGDVVMIQPRNDPVVVEEFIKRYGLEPEMRVKISFDPEQGGQVC